ncbi:hypothetical protein [Aequorivita antarctica]|uniref:PorT family protein n=1 Tax=Aequorivita antarctica TaxID=153266 RepID=A0A5C6YZL7_9FLAO|nr:hypothetical protein [Aequorivita antarctica]TXD72712.1 hypothetical protein ESU54_10850 [Aequorivita antarctica]SRX74764.1 hypothetical protein AEQU3_01744 [Aequorivita antarctica]
MKNSIYFLSIFLAAIFSSTVNAQETVAESTEITTSEKIDHPLGLRVKKDGVDYLIYSDQNLAPNFEDYRKINYQVYFRKIQHPVKEIDGKKYQLITIPGSSKTQDQTPKSESLQYPNSGTTVSSKDYDKNFWIEESVIEKNTNTEYYKFANQVFSGLLTAPFKYRLKLGNAPESLIDGDFNVAPFIGWKWRLSNQNPYYVAPFIFAGVTTLNYNSANNSGITDESVIENGTGITYGAGISFRIGSVSPGIILGFDHSLGNLGSTFTYKDKAWLSFSVNYDFFKPKKETKTEDGQ